MPLKPLMRSKFPSDGDTEALRAGISEPDPGVSEKNDGLIVLSRALAAIDSIERTGSSGEGMDLSGDSLARRKLEPEPPSPGERETIRSKNWAADDRRFSWWKLSARFGSSRGADTFESFFLWDLRTPSDSNRFSPLRSEVGSDE